MKRAAMVFLPSAILLLLCVLCVLRAQSSSAMQLDPAAWGSDHAGKPVPEYVTGDECLFCHRNDVGPSWTKNRHHLNLREAEAGSPEIQALKNTPAVQDLAKEVTLVLGKGNRLRFLRPAEAYGKLDLLSVEWVPPRENESGKLISTNRPHWDQKMFADACAGCHMTGVDSKTRTFSAKSLDCYVCHGEVDVQHSKDTALVLLSKKRQDPAHVSTSICAQCHVRGGKSVSTGLAYPNNFVAGDNLFRDFKVDLSGDSIARLNPADRHILENVRDVARLGKEEVTCLSCHDVHKQSTKKHHSLARTDYCLICHNQTGSMKIRKPYEVHSQTCGY